MSDGRDNPRQTRRAFLRGAARGAILAGIGAAAVLLTRGRRAGGRPLSACVNDARCGACPRLGGCVLPAARYTRELREGE